MSFYAFFPVVISAIAMIMDIKNGQIDNGWLVFCLFIEMIVQIAEKGWIGIFLFLSGMLLPAVLLGILFVFHMLGAGDIKLFCVIVGLIGPYDIAVCIMYSMFLGAFISFFILILNDNFCQRFAYFYNYIHNIVEERKIIPYAKKGIDHIENYHFTVPIFMSTLLYMGGIY